MGALVLPSSESRFRAGPSFSRMHRIEGKQYLFRMTRAGNGVRWFSGCWTGGVPGQALDGDVGEDCRVDLVGQVGAESDSDIEGLVEMEDQGRAEGTHRFAVDTHVKDESIAVLLKRDPARHQDGAPVGPYVRMITPDAIHLIAARLAIAWPLRERESTSSVNSGDGFLRVVLKALPD